MGEGGKGGGRFPREMMGEGEGIGRDVNATGGQYLGEIPGECSPDATGGSSDPEESSVPQESSSVLGEYSREVF